MDSNENRPGNSDQKYLGNKGLIAFIALMNMFIPLSTDMYLPALPGMSTYFSSSSAVTNLTLSIFFLLYSVGILIWGPLSDKYGRKSVLIISGVIYTVSSAACALSPTVYFLIISRAFQGIGTGGIISVSTAIIKDSFSGKKRETILAVSQTIAGIAPMLAPVIGAFILGFTSWRGTFWTLAVISILNLVFALLFQETLKEEEKYTGSLAGALGRLVAVSKNKSYIIPAVLFSLCSLPFMGYLAMSSFIYVEHFSLSVKVYSYFFAANAFFSLLGPFIYIKFLTGVNKSKLTYAVFLIMAASGILVMTVGNMSPFLFWLTFMIFGLFMSLTRPYSVNIILEQQKSDTGSASSIMNTLFTVLGSIGMSLASLPWKNPLGSLGAMIFAASFISALGWWLFMKSKISCAGLKDI